MLSQFIAKHLILNCGKYHATNHCCMETVAVSVEQLPVVRKLVKKNFCAGLRNFDGVKYKLSFVGLPLYHMKEERMQHS